MRRIGIGLSCACILTGFACIGVAVFIARAVDHE